MMKCLLYIWLGLIAPLLLTTFAPVAFADDAEQKELLKSITSVAAAKHAIRESLATAERAASGAGLNFAYTQVCEIVAALDINTGYAITGTMTGGKSADTVAISAADRKAMRLIFDQCRPTNYQYWNFDNLLHVTYSPSRKASDIIYKYLGIN
jgi:hypothetical protein